MRGTTEAINLVAQTYGRVARRRGRRDPHLRDGAPLEHRAVAAALRAEGRAAARRADDRRRRAAARRVRSAADPTARKIVAVVARLERARHDQSGSTRSSSWPTRAAFAVLVDGAQAVAAHAGRRAGARLRLLRVLRAQDVRPDRHRRALRQGAAARGDAAVSGRRRHDPLGHASRRRSTTSLPYKFEAGTPNIAGAIGLGAALEYLDGRWASSASRRTSTSCLPTARSALRTFRASGSSARRARRPASCRSCWTTCTRTTSARSSTAKASRSAPATTAASR